MTLSRNTRIDQLINNAADNMMTQFHRDVSPVTMNNDMIDDVVEDIINSTYGNAFTLSNFVKREVESQYNQALNKLMYL